MIRENLAVQVFRKMIEIDCESLYIKSLLVVSSTVMIGILGCGYLMISEHNLTLLAEIAPIGNIQSNLNKITYANVRGDGKIYANIDNLQICLKWK